MEAVPHLRRGAGHDPSDGGCIMQIVDWVSTGGWNDRPKCVHPFIADVAIRANDAASDEERQQLLDLIPRMMNTANTRNLGLQTELGDLVEQFNIRWWGEDWRTAPKMTTCEARHVFDMLHEMLDVCDKHLGRTKHKPVDLSGVCAVMAATS